MKGIIATISIMITLLAGARGQQNPPAMNVPKDARVDLTLVEAKSGEKLNNEIVIFRSQLNGREYQGLTDSSGQFSLRLPAGAKYDIYVLGFSDSTVTNVLDIPALKENQFFKNPFKVDVKFEAPKSFILDNVTFETGKAELKPESFVTLDELVAYLKRKDDERIEIGGHTDNVGNAKSNEMLSLNRANAVMIYLITKGIAPDRLTAKGYGMTQPIDDNKTAEGRATNRRTEVKIL